MLEKTILVIDVDLETEEKIVSTLEAEDYLVFAASGREITSGMAGKISPALIFLKPTSNSVEGFEICKTIHSSEAFKDVPIIVLASLKGPLDSRYTSFYGIVDFLAMPVSPEAVIEKTEKVLGRTSPDYREPLGEDAMSIEEESAPAEKRSSPRDEVPLGVEGVGSIEEESMAAKKTYGNQDRDPLDQEFKDPLDREFKDEESGRTDVDYSYRDEEENAAVSHNRGRRGRPKKSGLTVAVLLVIAAIAIVAGGFVTYKLFFSPTSVRVPAKVAVPKAVQKAPPILPSAAEQQKEQPVAEVKPPGTKEAPQEAPEQALPQAPQKASAVVPAAKPGEGTSYSVQLGAFKSEVSADALAKVYKGKGHEAFTHKGTTKDNRPVYRVLIGKFKTRKEASQLADELQAGEKIKTIIFGEGKQ